MKLKFMERDEKILYIQDLVEPYLKAFGTGLGLYKKGKKPAVLVIDIQNSATTSESPLGPQDEDQKKRVDGHVENSKILIEAARKKNIPIIYFGVSFNRKDGLDCGVLAEKIRTAIPIQQEGSRLVQIDDRIKPQPEDFMIWKKHFSAFAGTDLVGLLNNLGVDSCIVVGNSTSGCVRATVYDAVAYNFRTVVPEECVTDRGLWAHKASLFDIWAKIADVASLEEVLDWIRSL